MRFLKRLEKSIRRTCRETWHNRSPVALKPVDSYAAYKEAQNAGNARKLAMVAAREANIAHLARYAVRSIGRHDLRVLCHGTRNGTEIRWFQTYLPEATTVLGTEIADTATLFPNTIQWDFHDAKDEWLGAWDVIYSNSWDHAFDPRRAFRTWMECLSPGGVMLLEHCRFHTPAHVTDLDPFGATFNALQNLLNKIGAPRWSVTDIINDLPESNEQMRVLVVRELDSVPAPGS